MKKTLALIIAALICLTALCGCSGSSDNVGTPSAQLPYDEESYFIPGETSKPTESPDESGEGSAVIPSDDSKPSEIGQPGGFAVKLAKYAYEGNNVAILNVTNETEKNYSITVHGSYLDENGNVLKTETQKWEQFEAGYQKFFLFKPDIQFDRFTYSLETAEFEGECPVCGFEVKSCELKEVRFPVAELCEQGDRANHPQIITQIRTQNNGNKELDVGRLYLIVIGSDGEIYKIARIDSTGTKRYIPGLESYRTVDLFYTTEDKIEWPEELKGEVTFIVACYEITVVE